MPVVKVSEAHWSTVSLVCAVDTAPLSGVHSNICTLSQYTIGILVNPLGILSNESIS